MKLSTTIENLELPKTVTRAIEESVEKLINNLVEAYQDSLQQNGYYLPPSEIEALKKFIRGDMTVKLNLSVSITKKKLDDWHMSPIKATQSFFELVPNREDDKLKNDSTVTVSLNGNEGTTLTMDQFSRLPGFIEKNAQKLANEEEAFREERKKRVEAQA